MRLPEREREECEKERAIEKEEKDKVGSERRQGADISKCR
jgi:hypothetical protein